MSSSVVIIYCLVGRVMVKSLRQKWFPEVLTPPTPTPPKAIGRSQSKGTVHYFLCKCFTAWIPKGNYVCDWSIHCHSRVCYLPCLLLTFCVFCLCESGGRVSGTKTAWYLIPQLLGILNQWVTSLYITSVFFIWLKHQRIKIFPSKLSILISCITHYSLPDQSAKPPLWIYSQPCPPPPLLFLGIVKTLLI